MELYVDTADLNIIKEIAAYYPVDGFTTNPKLLSDKAELFPALMSEYKAYIHENHSRIFVQVTGKSANEMLNQALTLKDFFGSHLIVKIPATKEGFRAGSLCQKNQIPFCITVVHSSMQGLIAAKVGASYIAPYISHIDNLGADGVACVEEMLEMIDYGGYNCKILGASFRTADQIKRLATIGCQAVTLAPNLFDLLIAHASTDQSMNKFEDAWLHSFGTKQVNDLLK